MTADVDLDTLTRLAQAAERVETGEWPDRYNLVRCGWIRPAAHYLAAVSPDVVLALVERVRAAETAIERVRALVPDDEQVLHGDYYHATCVDMYGLEAALDGPEAARNAPESDRDRQNAAEGVCVCGARADEACSSDCSNPQNAANEGDA